MKAVYPVVFTKLSDGYMAYSPDFNINTQGNDLAEAISMARDAIGIVGIDMEDDKKPFPAPSAVETILCSANELVSMVDVDFTAYRMANERRTIRKNVTLPSWLNAEADAAGVNFSHVLQEGLKARLGIQ